MRERWTNSGIGGGIMPRESDEGSDFDTTTRPHTQTDRHSSPKFRNKKRGGESGLIRHSLLKLMARIGVCTNHIVVERNFRSTFGADCGTLRRDESKWMRTGFGSWKGGSDDNALSHFDQTQSYFME